MPPSPPAPLIPIPTSRPNRPPSRHRRPHLPPCDPGGGTAVRLNRYCLGTEQGTCTDGAPGHRDYSQDHTTIRSQRPPRVALATKPASGSTCHDRQPQTRRRRNLDAARRSRGPCRQRRRRLAARRQKPTRHSRRPGDPHALHACLAGASRTNGPRGRRNSNRPPAADPDGRTARGRGTGVVDRSGAGRQVRRGPPDPRPRQQASDIAVCLPGPGREGAALSAGQKRARRGAATQSRLPGPPSLPRVETPKACPGLNPGSPSKAENVPESGPYWSIPKVRRASCSVLKGLSAAARGF